MTDPWQTPDENGVPAQPTQTPPAYGAPASYGAPPAGYGVAPGPGPVGRTRGTGVSILLFVVTFGIYGLVYNYKVHSEMQRHSDRGIGGAIALLLTVIAGIAMPFVTSSEVGSLYVRRGDKPPVKAVTGLWALLSLVLAYLVYVIAIVAAAVGGTSVAQDGSPQLGDGSGAALALAAVAGVAIYLAGAITWFVKTNGALNRYWVSVGASA